MYRVIEGTKRVYTPLALLPCRKNKNRTHKMEVKETLISPMALGEKKGISLFAC